MASLVEKYEQILAADPRSRIFVELAKALVDRGDHARAVEVCQRGLEHHPSSILGRVIWGRALLEAGDAKGAMDQFDIAIALEPSKPYAYNLVGEALLRKGLLREALPVLARASELQPGDARVKSWLDDAKQKVKDGGGEHRAVQGADRAGESGPAAASSATATTSGADTNAPAPGTAASPTAAASGTEAANAPAPGAPAPPAAARGPAAGSAPASNNGAPPPLPPGAPPPVPGNGARSLLQMIPGGTREMPAAKLPRPKPQAARPVSAAEVDKIAAQYERELREKLMAAPEPPPPFFHRHRRALIGGAVAVAVAAAAGVYLLLDARNAALQAAGAAGRGRAGLARDTLGSLRDAHRLLTEARQRKPDDREIASLAAAVATVLATDYGDGDAREIASRLSDADGGGDGGIAARYLLARDGPKHAKAEKDVLAAPTSSEPFLQALAGRILVGRGEVETGRTRLESAARSNPPFLRALSDLGDASLAQGELEDALSMYGAALAAHPTHARSALGAAEARLRSGKDLDVALKELSAVSADPNSAPPRDVRVRFDIVFARVLAATGDTDAGVARLAAASQANGETGALAAAAAELYLDVRAWDKAEAAAARAVSREPREASHRVLLARARIGRARYLEALATTEGQDGRAIRIQRAIAWYRLGKWNQARAELEKTARQGKMPAEAAVWYALTDVGLGRAARALPLLEKLAAAKTPPPLAHVALGGALEASDKKEEAEAAYRAATKQEPRAPEGYLALGKVLLEGGRAADAVAPLESAVKLDGSDLAARRALAEACLAAGDAAAARRALEPVLLATPRDATAHRLMSAAWLAEKQPREARRSAEQAVRYGPKDPAALAAAARAASAGGDDVAAKQYALRALRSRATGADATDARRIAGAAPAKAAPKAAAKSAAKRTAKEPARTAAKTATKEPAKKR